MSLREIDAWVASFRHDPMVSDDGFASAPTQRAAVQRRGFSALARIGQGMKIIEGMARCDGCFQVKYTHRV